VEGGKDERAFSTIQPGIVDGPKPSYVQHTDGRTHWPVSGTASPDIRFMSRRVDSYGGVFSDSWQIVIDLPTHRARDTAGEAFDTGISTLSIFGELGGVDNHPENPPGV
jgi:hypothetical protein